MPNVPIGSQKTDTAKTPTLRQWFKAKEGNVPQASVVTVIFKPNKAPNYTLVCDHGFRVSILEDNPLFNALVSETEKWQSEEACLMVEIDDGSKGAFTLSLNTNELCEWEEFTWGYKLSVKNKPQTRTKTTTR